MIARVNQSARIDGQILSFLDLVRVINHAKFLDGIVDDVNLVQSALLLALIPLFPYTTSSGLV